MAEAAGQLHRSATGAVPTRIAATAQPAAFHASSAGATAQAPAAASSTAALVAFQVTATFGQGGTGRATLITAISRALVHPRCSSRPLAPIGDRRASSWSTNWGISSSRDGWASRPPRLPIFIRPLRRSDQPAAVRQATPEGRAPSRFARPALGTVAALLCFLLAASSSPQSASRFTMLARAGLLRVLPQSHQPHPGRVSRRRQGGRRHPEVDERARIARGRGGGAPLRQPDRADLSRPRHLPHHRPFSQEQPGGRPFAGRLRPRAVSGWVQPLRGDSCSSPPPECRTFANTTIVNSNTVPGADQYCTQAS